MPQFLVHLSGIQPTQLYISQAKLAAVQSLLANGGINGLEPIPVGRLGDALVSTDGHTRMVAARLAGHTHVKAVWETDELDWEAYEICVRWCREEGIRTAQDLVGRVVSEQEYESLWLARCRRMHDDLQRHRDANGCI